MKKKYVTFSNEETQFLYDSSGKRDINEVSTILGKPVTTIRHRIQYLNSCNPANKIKLKRVPRVSKKSWRNETSCTVPCICSAIYRGESIEQIAEDTARPIEQIEYIYERSLKDGSYNRIKSYQERSYRVEFNQRKISYRRFGAFIPEPWNGSSERKEADS